jgi:hypothetical protein
MAANTNSQISGVLTPFGSSALSAVPPLVITNQGAVVDNSGEQDVIVVHTRGRTRCVIEVSNRNGGAALTVFKVYGRVADGLFGLASQPGALGSAFVGDWMQLLGNAAADYTTPIGPLKYSFGAANAAVSPITLAANAKVILALECLGYSDIRCTAQCATSTTLDLYGEAA